MDEQQKKAAAAPRKPISREKMLEYLYRHKLKKKYRPIQPHTFANSQGLRIRQLQNESSDDTQKAVINKNVKARLESNLQFLLENQNLNVTRVKNPESFISLNVKKLKGGNKSTSTSPKSHDGSTQTDKSHLSGSKHGKQRGTPKVTSILRKSPSSASVSSRLSSKSVAFHNAGISQSGHRLMPPPNLPTKSGHKKKLQPDDLTFSKIQTPPLTSNRPNVIADADSFDFHSVRSQNRAGQQFMSTTSSKSRQSDKRDSKKYSAKVPESHRSSASNQSTRSNAFRFDNDGPFDFDSIQARTPAAFPDVPDPFFENQPYRNSKGAQAKGWTVTSNFDNQPVSFDAEFQPNSRFGLQPSGHVSPSNMIDSCFRSNTFSTHRSRNGTVQETRIIRTSYSRIGESPFIERIVIEKTKQKF